MPTPKSARQFIIETLRQHPDRELRISDICALSPVPLKAGAVDKAVRKLLEDGLVVRTIDSDRSVWWAIAP